MSASAGSFDVRNDSSSDFGVGECLRDVLCISESSGNHPYGCEISLGVFGIRPAQYGHPALRFRK